MTTEDKTKDKTNIETEEKEAVNPAETAEVKDEAAKQPQKKKTAKTKKEPESAKTDDKETEETEKAGEENPLVREFSVEVSKEDIEKDFNEALDKYSSEIKLPGFRKGKVPVEVVKSRFKDAVTEEVINKAVQDAVFAKIDKDKLKVISQPEVLKVDHEEGKDLKADVRVEVFPTITLPDFETLEAEVPAAELKQEPYDEAKQIDMVLEGNRRQSPVVSREIRDDDYVMYKFQSKILQTKRMTPRKSNSYTVKEQEQSEILDFYKEIAGKKLDEEFIIKRTYPEDYSKKPWAGKDVEHYIKIESIFEMLKPELDDDFVKKIGFEDLESFKKKLKEEYDQYAGKQLDDKKMKHIVDTLNEAVSFPVPQSMVNQELQRMFSQGGLPPIDPNDEGKMKEHVDKMKDEAEKSLRFSFIVETIKEEHKLEPTSADLENEYKNVAEHNNMPVKEVRKFYMKKENAQQLKDNLARTKVMDFLKEKIKIKEV
jgi:trigger factor